jgi:hypothetical protein
VLTTKCLKHKDQKNHKKDHERYAWRQDVSTMRNERSVWTRPSSRYQKRDARRWAGESDCRQSYVTGVTVLFFKSFSYATDEKGSGLDGFGLDLANAGCFLPSDPQHCGFLKQSSSLIHGTFTCFNPFPTLHHFPSLIQSSRRSTMLAPHCKIPASLRLSALLNHLIPVSSCPPLAGTYLYSASPTVDYRARSSRKVSVM